MLFTGFPSTALMPFALVWLIIYLSIRREPIVFDPEGKHGEFAKRLFSCTWI
jgi:hypothetical protein